MTKQRLKVYTKTGDKGQTSLFGGKRVPKFSLRIEAVGTVDELNSAIGVAIAEIQNSKFKSQKFNSKVKSELIQIQNDLLDIGSSLASPSYSSSERSESRSSRQARTIENLEKRTKDFEDLIDDLSSKLPPLTQFILPGGGEAGSRLHLCRTIVRRAERRIIELSKKEEINSSIIVYMNRLSDLLFTMARFVNFKQGKKEIIWEAQF